MKPWPFILVCGRINLHAVKDFLFEPLSDGWLWKMCIVRHSKGQAVIFNSEGHAFTIIMPTCLNGRWSQYTQVFYVRILDKNLPSAHSFPLFDAVSCFHCHFIDAKWSYTHPFNKIIEM